MLDGVGAAGSVSEHVGEPTGILVGAERAAESSEEFLSLMFSELFSELGDAGSSRHMGESLFLEGDQVTFF